MTKMEIAKMGKEFDENFWTKYVDEKGKMTEEGIKIADILNNEKVFKCPHCGEMCSYGDLNVWDEDTIEDIVNDGIGCVHCYEEEMGEDL